MFISFQVNRPSVKQMLALHSIEHSLQKSMPSPLQDEWGVGLAVARVMDVDGVSSIGSELSQRSLAATHALCQAAAGACCPQGKRTMVSMAHHQWVGAGDVAWGGRDVS